MRDTVFAVLRGNNVVSTNYKTLFRIVYPGVLLWVYETLPLVFFHPALLGIDTLCHVVLALREETCHLIADVAIMSDKVHVQGEDLLQFEKFLKFLHVRAGGDECLAEGVDVGGDVLGVDPSD